MVTGTLEGKPVPWFDQVMAWNFNKDGKITKTVFWSDTFYWHSLYQEFSSPSQAATLATTGNSSGVSDLLHSLLIGFIFASGVCLGRYSSARKDDKDCRSSKE